MSELKAFVHDAFRNYKSETFKTVNDFLALVTLVSVVGIILETVDSFAQYDRLFRVVEYFSVSLFTMEYFARISAADKKLKYIFSFFGLIDLLSIVPSFLHLGNLTFLKSVRLLRILRFLRILRLIKITRLEQERVMHTIKPSELYILNLQIYFVTLFTAITCWGSVIYLVEGHMQEQLRNIPLAMVWTAKILMGGVPNFPVSTFGGELVLIGTRFTGLVLLGLLIHVVGSVVSKLLFGSEIQVERKTRKKRK